MIGNIFCPNLNFKFKFGQKSFKGVIDNTLAFADYAKIVVRSLLVSKSREIVNARKANGSMLCFSVTFCWI